jgi:hypothetical protein
MATGKPPAKQPAKQAPPPAAATPGEGKAQDLLERERAQGALAKEQQDTAARAAASIEEPAEEQEEEAEVKETAADAAKLTTDDAFVIAQIGEFDRQGRVELRAGNLAYLKTRHEIGRLLETHYGGKARLERGKQIVKEVSRRYDISTSELYRCWKFYKLRPDFDAFCDEFPDVTSWTAVKELLPSLEGGDIEAKRKKHEHQALIERINDDLKALRKGLTGDLRENVPPSELRDLANQLRESSQEVVALVIIPGQRFDSEGKPIQEEAVAAT